jgi:hypothetical protein
MSLGYVESATPAVSGWNLAAKDWQSRLPAYSHPMLADAELIQVMGDHGGTTLRVCRVVRRL